MRKKNFLCFQGLEVLARLTWWCWKSSLGSSPGPIWGPSRFSLRTGPFLIFINEIPDNIRSSVRLFADDCVLYRNIKSPIDCQWETDWQMEFNVAKCHSLRVTRHLPNKHILFDNALHQQKLEHVQSVKILEQPSQII